MHCQVIRFSYDSSRKKTVFNSFAKLFSRSEGGGKAEKEGGQEEGESSTVVDSAAAVTPTVPVEGAGQEGAGGDGLVDENSVRRLMDMGFVAEVSRSTLLKYNGNETAAINELLSSYK